MNIQKPIYRFLSAFLMIAVLLAMVAPTGAEGSELVKKLCNMPPGQQSMSMPMNGSSSPQTFKTDILSIDKKNNDSCRTEEVYICCLSESPVGTKATPVSQTISSKIVALQIATVNQPTTPCRRASSFEHQFLEAVTSSPPLFLKNSSFLN